MPHRPARSSSSGRSPKPELAQPHLERVGHHVEAGAPEGDCPASRPDAAARPTARWWRSPPPAPPLRRAAAPARRPRRRADRPRATAGSRARPRRSTFTLVPDSPMSATCCLVHEFGQPDTAIDHVTRQVVAHVHRPLDRHRDRLTAGDRERAERQARAGAHVGRAQRALGPEVRDRRARRRRATRRRPGPTARARSGRG